MLNHKDIKSYIAILLVAPLFLACRVGKPYQRPELELPQQFSAQSFADTSSIADMEWRNFFSDPALQALIEKGISKNHDLLVAIKNMEIAGQQVKQSRALQLPEVDLQLTGQVTRPSDNSLNGISIKSFLGKSYVENYNAAFTLSWEADIWGKIRARKEIALSNYLQTTEAARAVQTKLVAGIARGYYNLLMLDRQLDIARRNLSLSDSFLVATRLLKDAGLGTELAVQQAESRRQSTAILIPQLELEITIQENALQVLTGQLPGTISRNARLEDHTPLAALPAGLPVAMVSRRPDVRAAELDLVIANAETGIAQANMYPALNISAGAGLEAFKASNWFNIPGSLFGIAAGTIAQPVFKRRALRTQFDISKIEREQAVIKFRQAVLLAATEVTNALAQTEKLKQQEQVASAKVNALRGAIDNAQLLFKSDMAGYLDVITAQGNSLDAELGLALVRRQQLDAVVELYRALGGGWE